MLIDRLRVLYLHGFASSPASRKATFFSSRLRDLGFNVEIPDLAQGNFEGLTISGQLRLLERLDDGQPLILIGSSLGGYIASLYAARHASLYAARHAGVRALVLLAPAFQFYRLWTEKMLPEELARWKAVGSVPVFHYGEGREMAIGYDLLDDASRFEPMPDFRQPTLLFHGNEDSAVPVEYSVEFARHHANAHLIRLASGHELTDVLAVIWSETQKFLLPFSRGI